MPKEKRRVSVALLLDAMTTDLTLGGTAGWDMIRDVLDAAYDGNLITERIADGAIKGGREVWAALTTLTSEKLSGVYLDTED